MTGLQVFEAMLAGHVPRAPITETLDFMLIAASHGRAVFQGRPLPRHYNPLGTVHGGWFATLLDSAVACAVHSTLPAGKAYTTAELKINIVRALTAKVPLVRADGSVIHVRPPDGHRRRPADRPGRHALRSRHHHLLRLRHTMRLLHTMLRVGNLQRSIDFYTKVLGMQLLRTTERPEQKYTLAFVGYGNNPEQAEIELTYNYGVDRYDLGTAYGHIALDVPDAYAACDADPSERAATVTREAGPVKGGTTVIAFVTDPDGYKIELIERKGD